MNAHIRNFYWKLADTSPNFKAGIILALILIGMVSCGVYS